VRAWLWNSKALLRAARDADLDGSRSDCGDGAGRAFHTGLKWSFNAQSRRAGPAIYVVNNGRRSPARCVQRIARSCAFRNPQYASLGLPGGRLAIGLCGRRILPKKKNPRRVSPAEASIFQDAIASLCGRAHRKNACGSWL